MTDKFLAIGTNGTEERNPLTTSTGAPDADRIVSTGADGRLDETVMPLGVAPDVYIGNAFESLSAGAFVYIRSNGTVANASAASGGTGAVGYVTQSYTTGTSARVYFEGTNAFLTGLTVGVPYYLSNTVPGGVTTTIPTGTGTLFQPVGTSVSATTINAEIARPIVRA